MADVSTGAATLVSHLRPGSWRGVIMPGWLFTFLALLLLSLLVFLGLLVVVSATYVDPVAESPDRMIDRGWAVLSSVALLWAMVNLHWSYQATRSHDGAKKSHAVYGHFAITIGCGLIVLGIHSVMLARSFGTRPIVMDYSHHKTKSGNANRSAVAAAEGDAVEGRKVFSTTCITCHGPTGGGLPNLAPSLRGSPFIASADDATIAGVIRLGRAATDPANKTKKVMPARGGNPFLSDDKIAHLVAFIREIQTESSDPVGGAQDPNAPPPVQLAKWVVPVAPPPPTGMVPLEARRNLGDDRSLRSRDQGRRHGLVHAFTLALSGVHCVFLIGVMIASSNVVVRGLVDERSIDETTREDQSLWKWATLGWVVAIAVWFVIFLYGFLML